MTNPRSLLVYAAALAVSLTASAQVTVLSENFESTSGGSLPSNWTAFANGGTVQSVDNLYTGGINPSSRALQLSGPSSNGGVGNLVAFNYVASPVLDLSGYFTGTGTGALANGGVSINLNFEGAANANFGQLMAVGFADSSGAVYEWYAAHVNWNNQSFTTTGLGVNSGGGVWWSASLNNLETALPGSGFDPSAVRLVFAHLDGANGAFNYTTNYLDNVSVTAIPEPSTYAALAGLGALGLAIYRRRRASAV